MVIELKENGKLNFPAAEESITLSIIEMHDYVVKILRENSIIERDNDKLKNKIEIIIRQVLKLQNTFVSLNQSSQWNTESIITSMKPELEASFGATMSKEIGDMLVSMQGVLNESFGQLKSRLDEMESNIVKAIK
jgi:superoxide dismutase